MKAIGYCRVSTEHQAEEGVSLAAQEQRIRAYGQAFDIDVVEIITDAGVSAKSLDRPGLQAALRLLATGAADSMVVAKLDRLTRSVVDLGALLEHHFHNGGAGLVSVAENIDTASAAGRLVLNVLVSVGQWEREAVAERTREALGHLRAQGVQLGAPAFGWRHGDQRDADGRRVVEAVPEEQRTLSRISELRGQGQTLRVIADTLNAEGHPTKRGRAWHATSVNRVLRRSR